MERVAAQTKAPACHVKQPPPPSKPYCVGRHHSCTGQTKAAAWLRKLFLWASEGNVRHPRAPPANVPAGRLRACEPCLGPFARPQTLLRRGQCRLPGVKPFPGPLAALLHCSYAGQRPQLGPESFFLWASEGDVRHPRAPPSNASRQPAGLPRPLCGLSEACLFSSPTGPARKRSCRP